MVVVFWRRWVRRLFSSGLIILVLMAAANIWVIKSTEDRVYSDYQQLPDNEVALVLGTSHRLVDGSPNPFFENRIKAAATLYHEGKVIHFILSGDNETRYYNEPAAMKKALLSRGVPDSVITLDFAGLRTLDSIVRCKEVFGQNKFTIITQPFHCYRALFISAYYDINAVALAAKEPAAEAAFKVYLREYFARTKAILDLYVLKISPRYLGDKEPLAI